MCIIQCLVPTSTEKQTVTEVWGRHKGVRIIQISAALGVWSAVLLSLLKCKREVPLNFSCAWHTPALLGTPGHWACLPLLLQQHSSRHPEELPLNLQGFLESCAHVREFLVHLSHSVFQSSLWLPPVFFLGLELAERSREKVVYTILSGPEVLFRAF